MADWRLRPRRDGGTFDSADTPRLRVGSSVTLGIFAGVVGYAHGGRTIASVAAVDVDPAAMVVTGDFAVQNGNTVSATFDATAAVANEEFYKVCWQVDYADGQHEVWLLRLLILGGCGT